MKKAFLMAVWVMVLMFGCSIKASAESNSLDTLVEEYAAAKIEEAENMNDIVKIFYTNLCDQKGSAVKFAGNIDLGMVDTLFQSALAIDLPTNNYDGVILWANIDHIDKAIAQKDGAYYVFLKADFRYSFDEMEDYINRVSKQLDLSQKTDSEKVNIIYNFIRANYSYDNSLSVFDCITAQKNGNNEMVCQGYSTLAYLLGKKAGLDIEILISETHSWNCVRMNNDTEYQQFDITNNKRIGDKLSDTESYVIRTNYFLYTNKNIKLQEQKRLFQEFLGFLK